MIALPLAGLCLLALGFLADQLGWWTTRPFLTNLVSSATSACFGIPFALLILSALAAHQADEQQRTNAERLMDSALEMMAAAVARVTTGSTHERVDVGIDSFTTQALEHADHVGALLAARPEQAQLPALRHAVLTLVDALSELRDFLRGNLSYRVDMEERWAGARSQWRFLDEYVKPRILEQGLEWIRQDASERFDTVLRGGPNPFLRSLSLRDQTLPELITMLSRLAAAGTEEYLAANSAKLERGLDQLNRETKDARAELPRAMRLREALALARGRSFQVDLVPGRGLRL